MHVPPIRLGAHGQRLFSSQTARKLLKVLFPPMLIFTPLESNTQTLKQGSSCCDFNNTCHGVFP